MSSDTPFPREIIERERARRDIIRDRIGGLLDHEQREQREREEERKARFDELWKAHAERLARAGQRSQQTSSAAMASNPHKGIPSGMVGQIASGNIPPVQNDRRGSRFLTWMRRN